ncbi:DJ-1 [Eremomyces bilateralis CBS 781.70]|uniref:D-lactate dehydratase n=1 Tax=Eremomyces bilateralis CBS 781.70 TaxID=1392243 RepID=A0A6G1FTX5_9PEZI|nr:DJ-1 [Eremomyces bilateralis CBS 781.70]KAF1809158.1 DJ-1 [Eremomyces bilateralis CBS 781.70]
MAAKTALVLIADGSEEIEFVTPQDVLIRAGFFVTSAGVNLEHNYATCSRNVRIVPDHLSLSASLPFRDILILPGGGPGAATFASSPMVRDLIRAYREQGRWVAFICAATTALVASAEHDGATGDGARKVRVTSHPSVKEAIVKRGWDYAPDSERVVVDGKVITSRGPGTAMLFALTIVEQMLGKETRDAITGPMICADTL